MISVTVNLIENKVYRFRCEPDDPMLTRLLNALVARARPGWEWSETMVELRLDEVEGSRSVYFLSSALVSVETNPPVKGLSSEIPEASTWLATIPISAGNVEIAPLVQVRNFLPVALHTKILDFAISEEKRFTPSSVSTNDLNYRDSRVLYQLGEIAAEFESYLDSRVRPIVDRLGHSLPKKAFSFETQLTAHNDGHFYKVHNDNGTPDTAKRVLSYVYYFYREPRGFEGGQLRIYDSKVENNFWVAADTFHDIEPYNNSIVLFLSRLMHEVMPVTCKSKTFADSRFTLNGWVRALD